ncbi:MAG: serine hydrolase domain-containing protein [Balneolaceae bacterium]|nr:serine hydrolase domain-containing protein [Balneolaceae bacterium]
MITRRTPSLLTLTLLLALVLAPAFVPPASAQHYPADLPALDERYEAAATRAHALIDSMMADQNIPGVQVAVSVAGATAWSEGFGWADVEQRVPVWPYTRMRIGSVSKTITSAALGKLMEAGRLDLDLPVQEYVPYFPEKEKDTITTRLVAGHLAGIRHYRGDEFMSDEHYPTVREGITIFREDTLLFEPGSDYSYSSYGWNLVSAVIEGASGRPYLDYMRSEVLDPLGMQQTVADYTTPIIHHRTAYYAQNEEGQLQNAPYVDNSYKWAGGGYLGTAEDLLIFGQAMMGDRFLTRTTVEELWRPMQTSDGESTGYGIGWSSGEDEQGRPWVGHSGGSVGGTTQFVVFPEQQVVVAIIANMGGVGYGDIHRRIAALFME